MPTPSATARTYSAVAARALALVAAGSLAGFAANAARPDGVRFSTYSPPIACTGPGAPSDAHAHAHAAGANAPAEERTIAPRKASSLCSRDDVVVLDARSAKRYSEGHVAGAVHLPCDAAGGAAHAAIAGLEKASTIIVYGEHDSDGESVAASIRARLPQGKRVVLLEGGFAAWEAASLSCVSGPCDECVGPSASHPHSDFQPQAAPPPAP